MEDCCQGSYLHAARDSDRNVKKARTARKCFLMVAVVDVVRLRNTLDALWLLLVRLSRVRSVSDDKRRAAYKTTPTLTVSKMRGLQLISRSLEG